MKYADVKAAWNAQADQFNQFDMLCTEEIVEFAMSIEREECAKIAQNTICFDSDKIGITVYGFNAAEAIRSKA